MPKSLKLELKNKFGDVYIAEHAADLYINVKHGELRAGKMISDKQEIEVSFGEVDIEELGSGQLDVKHGQCSIDKAKNLNVDMQFGAFSIKEVEKLDIDIKHGGLEIDKVSELRAEAGFGSVEIEEVSKSANIEVRHGSCQIDELKKGFTKVDVNASFGSVTIGLQDDLSGDFDIETSFGGFSYRQGNNIHLQREIKKSNSGSFSGIIGGGKGGKIYITTEHGSAEFK